MFWSGLSCTQYLDVAEPTLPDNDWVKIRTSFGGICGTDLSTIFLKVSLSLTPFCSFPSVLGHEGVGRICELGSAVNQYKLGQRVVVDPLLWCKPRGIVDMCPYCQRGETSLCQHTTDGNISPGIAIGSCHDTGGTWGQQFVAHQSQVHPIPETISDKNALMVEPFSVGLHAVLNNFPDNGETVMIIGAGTIGLCVISALRALGSNARLLVLARHSFQAEAAKRLGANEVILGSGQYVFQEIARYLGTETLKPMMGEPVMVGGADRTFECIGTQKSISNALCMTRPGGRVIIIGMPGMLRLDWMPITVKELTVRASWAYHRAEEFNGRKQATFDLSLDLMNQGKANLDWMVTHTFKLNEYAKAFQMLSKRSHYHLIKAAFAFD